MSIQFFLNLLKPISLSLYQLLIYFMQPELGLVIKVLVLLHLL